MCFTSPDVILDKFLKACGDNRSHQSDSDLLHFVYFILDEENTYELVKFVETSGAGAWNVPAHISLLILRELGRRQVRLSEGAKWFLEHEVAQGS